MLISAKVGSVTRSRFEEIVAGTGTWCWGRPGSSSSSGMTRCG